MHFRFRVGRSLAPGARGLLARTATTGLDRRLGLFRAEDADTLALGFFGRLFFEVVGHGDKARPIARRRQLSRA